METTVELFKVLAANGSAAHGGKGTWFLPQGKRPGKWMPPIAGPKLCQRGYHLVPAAHLLEWLTTDTFLVYAASMTVPSGFTADNLPVGITLFGRPYSEPTLLKLAYSYEQATHHRVPPKTTPALPTK